MVKLAKQRVKRWVRGASSAAVPSVVFLLAVSFGLGLRVLSSAVAFAFGESKGKLLRDSRRSVSGIARPFIAHSRLDAGTIRDMEQSWQVVRTNLSTVEGSWSLRVDSILRPADVLRLGEAFKPITSLGRVAKVEWVAAPTISVQPDGVTNTHLRLRWGRWQDDINITGQLSIKAGNRFTSRIKTVRAASWRQELQVNLPPRELKVTYSSPGLLLVRDASGVVDVLERIGTSSTPDSGEPDIDMSSISDMEVHDLKSQLSAVSMQLEAMRQEQASNKVELDGVSSEIAELRLWADSEQKAAKQQQGGLRSLMQSAEGGARRKDVQRLEEKARRLEESQREDVQDLKSEVRRLEAMLRDFKADVLAEMEAAKDSKDFAFKLEQLQDGLSKVKDTADNLFDEQMKLQRVVSKEADKAHVARKELLSVDGQLKKASSRVSDDIAALQSALEQMEVNSDAEMHRITAALAAQQEERAEEAKDVSIFKEQLSQLELRMDSYVELEGKVEKLQQQSGAASIDAQIQMEQVEADVLKAALAAIQAEKDVVWGRLQAFASKLEAMEGTLLRTGTGSEEQIDNILTKLEVLAGVHERLEALEQQTEGTKQVLSDLPFRLTKLAESAQQAVTVKEEIAELRAALRKQGEEIIAASSKMARDELPAQAVIDVDDSQCTSESAATGSDSATSETPSSDSERSLLGRFLDRFRKSDSDK
mmetsp:Transcript_10372/g.23427  ORF Transcript_10372/g.23427 Transcript_10372/m.23427 type:complete len:706 (+) Transcript_10372:95-2212(+)